MAMDSCMGSSMSLFSKWMFTDMFWSKSHSTYLPVSRPHNSIQGHLAWLIIWCVPDLSLLQHMFILSMFG